MNGSDLDRHIFGDYDQPDDLTYGEGYEDGYQEGRADGYSAGYDAAIDVLRARAERAEAALADVVAEAEKWQIGDEVTRALVPILARVSQRPSEVEQ